MRIKELQFKNFASYGNRLQTLNFDREQSDLYLVLGSNGAGKCLAKETKITVEIEDEKLMEEFKEFLKSRKSIMP
jgi:ABC-type multidrug transport system ATPase subunit